MEVQVLLSLALILLVAKIFGEIAERLRFSSMVGEVIAGIVLGPVLGLVVATPFLEQISRFGILFLLFIIGLSTNFDMVKKDIYTASILAIGGCGLSFVLGFLIGYILFNSLNIAIFLGVALLSTSTAITMRSIIDIGEFKTKLYNILLAIDMADEVLAILALSLFTTYAIFGYVEIWKVFGLFFVVIGFFLFIISFGSKIIGRALRIFQSMHDEQIIVTVSLAIVFIVAFASESVSIAGVTGAFLAGMAMSKSPITESVIIPKIKIIGYGFFIPLFFAYSAIILDITAFLSYFWIILLLVIIGFTAKFLGCGIFSGYFGFKRREQNIIGIGMLPHGEYSILIAQIALGYSIITRQLYTSVIAFVLITIILTPILLWLIYGKTYSFKNIRPQWKRIIIPGE
ncbi:MAG: cation:proton antiporter [Candidatus Aenigmatarchaeota archaeon]